MMSPSSLDAREVVVESGSRGGRGRWWPHVLKALRRTHLYLGLALLPWVLLYGSTALLFNHSDWLSRSRRASLDGELVRGTVLGELPSEEEFAAGMVQDLVAGDGELELELVEGSARWVGTFELRGNSTEGSVRMRLDPRGRGGYFQVTSEGSRDELPAWAQRAMEAPPSLRGVPSGEELSGLGKDLLRGQVGEVPDLESRRWPEVHFLARSGEDLLRCRFSLGGQLEVEPAHESPSLRRRLLRLHVQHGDPGHAGALRLWSLVVDLVGLAMVFWGASGLVMWWPLRRTRRSGTLAVAAGLGSMALLALAVWRASGLA